jgi:predicted MarR family transcription regulator
MEGISTLLTTTLSAIVLTVMAIEIKRRRKKLREIYDVLDSEHRHVVNELDRMVENGELKTYTLFHTLPKNGDQ